MQMTITDFQDAALQFFFPSKTLFHLAPSYEEQLISTWGGLPGCTSVVLNSVPNDHLLETGRIRSLVYNGVANLFLYHEKVCHENILLSFAVQ